VRIGFFVGLLVCLRTETGILSKRWQLSSRMIPAIYRAG
jgi:hypothetical protein